jgi:hypothetical protein
LKVFRLLYARNVEARLLTITDFLRQQTALRMSMLRNPMDFPDTA